MKLDSDHLVQAGGVCPSKLLKFSEISNLQDICTLSDSTVLYSLVALVQVSAHSVTKIVQPGSQLGEPLSDAWLQIILTAMTPLTTHVSFGSLVFDSTQTNLAACLYFSRCFSLHRCYQ